MAAKKKTDNDSYQQLTRELSEGHIRPLYLFYGEEDFLLENSWLKLKRSVLDEATAEIDSLSYKLDSHGNWLDLKKLAMELRTPPFFSKKRLILIQRSGYFSPKGISDEDLASLKEALKGMADSTCLVFWEDKADTRIKKVMSLIPDHQGLAVNFGKQDPAVLNSWVRAWLKREGLEIETVACESLVDRCEMDMRSLTQELTKLKLVCTYQKRVRIDLTLVNTVCRPDRRGSIFDLTDAISQGNTAEALRLLHLLWSNREPSQMILVMLARHFKQLLCAQEWSVTELTKSLGVPPFVARRLKEQTVHFTSGMLEALYEACCQSDLSIKTGKMGDETALEILLAQAGRAARQAGHARGIVIQDRR